MNNQEFHFSLSNLPCLIHGAHKAGSSLFTVSMLADFYTQGHKVLFLSGYHMARDDFLEQTNADDVILLEKESDLDIAKNKQVVFVKKEKADWFIRLVNKLPDINERVMVVKNYDLFNADVFESIKDRENIILSGDLDNCTFRDLIIKKTMKTTMLFSQPNIEIDFKMPTVPQYNGYMWGLDKGIVSIKV